MQPTEDICQKEPQELQSPFAASSTKLFFLKITEYPAKTISSRFFMKCNLSTLFLCFILAILPGTAKAQLELSPAEQSVMNCEALLGTAIDLSYRGEPVPFDVSIPADTLYDYLYINPVDMNASLQYLGKIHLQAFFALTGDNRIDYREIERCIAKTGKYDSFYSLPFIVCACNYATWAESVGERDKELAACQYGMKAHNKIYPGIDTPFSDLMNTLQFGIYLDKKNWRLAALFARKMLDSEKSCSGDASDSYFDLLSMYAFCSSMAGNEREALDAYSSLIAHCKSREGNNDKELAELFLATARLYENEKNYDAQLHFLIKADSIAGICNDDSIYLDVKQALAQFHFDRKDPSSVNEVLNDVADALEKSNNINLQNILEWIPYCSLTSAGNIPKRLGKIVSKAEDCNPLIKASCLGLLSSYAEDVSQAIDCKKRILGYCESSSPEDILEATPGMIQFFISIYDFDNALRFWNIELDHVKEIAGEEQSLYNDMLLSIALTYSMKHDYAAADKIFDRILADPGVTAETREKTMLEKSKNLTLIGDFESSNSLLDSLLVNTTDHAGRLELYDDYIMNLVGELDIMLNDSFADRERYEEKAEHLLKISTQSAELARNIYGEQHEEAVSRIQNLCAAHYFNRDFTKMHQTAISWRPLIESNINNPDLRNSYLESVAFFLSEAGDDTSAYDLLRNIKPSAQDAFLTDETSSMLYSKVLYSLGKKEEARSYMSRAIDAVLEKVRNGMATLTGRERMYYWRLYQHMIANAASLTDDGSATAYVGSLYDLALFSKGLLLTSEMNFVNAINRTGDADLIGKMELMRGMRENVVQSKDLTADERKRLMQRSTEIEKTLLESIKAEPSDSPITWKDVASRLPRRALAVELIEYQKEGHIPMYGALLLRCNSQNPEFMELGNKAGLDTLLRNNWRKDAATSLWRKIFEKAPDADTVFFAPTGIFHTIPLESAGQLPEGGFMADKKIHRVSSTRTVVQNRQRQLSNAVVIGDVDYNTLADIPGETSSRTAADTPGPSSGQSRRLMTTLKELPFTRQELANISASLSAQGVHVRPFRRNESSEALLRELSGQSISVLHIATHGAYLGKTLSGNSYIDIPGHTFNIEDLSLTMNLLYFAGANNSISGSYDGAYDNDGIISSLDIANMDFSSVDLVSLSACQSGLGQVTPDGIFGLQRGFKKAGAKSILMSLWSVDDEATMELMSEFYRHLASGKSKHESLEKAKEYVRNDGRHSHPRYWAAFILLDGN